MEWSNVWQGVMLALVPILGGLASWLVARVVGLIVAKIGCLTLEKKQRITRSVVGFAEIAATKTAQTYVDARKEASKDGKLTDEEKGEALKQAKALLISMLKDDGVDVLKDVGSALLDSTLEFFVRKLSLSRAETVAATAGN